jgi:hypothetical protein|tara:strand:+ start:2145 stop:2288 length:144 start_codon:yes stop_codon:yes gene_type:complete
MRSITREQIKLHNIIPAEIGLGLPFDDISGMGLIKNQSEDSAEPIIL